MENSQKPRTGRGPQIFILCPANRMAAQTAIMTTCMMNIPEMPNPPGMVTETSRKGNSGIRAYTLFRPTSAAAGVLKSLSTMRSNASPLAAVPVTSPNTTSSRSSPKEPTLRPRYSTPRSVMSVHAAMTRMNGMKYFMTVAALTAMSAEIIM